MNKKIRNISIYLAFLFSFHIVIPKDTPQSVPTDDVYDDGDDEESWNIIADKK